MTLKNIKLKIKSQTHRINMKRNKKDNQMNENEELKNAVLLGNLSKVKTLINGVDLNVINNSDKFGRSILYDAITKGYPYIVTGKQIGRAHV